MSFEVIVKAISLVDKKELSEEDREVLGEYIISLLDEVIAPQIADAALDVFHDNIAVDCLDDFNFEVWQNGKQYTPDDNHDSNSFKNLGSM